MTALGVAKRNGHDDVVAVLVEVDTDAAGVYDGSAHLVGAAGNDGNERIRVGGGGSGSGALE
jgi:hypothetical protein